MKVMSITNDIFKSGSDISRTMQYCCYTTSVDPDMWQTGSDLYYGPKSDGLGPNNS